MTTRFVKGKARTETPRLKDNHLTPTVRERSAGRDANGRFAPGNSGAIGRAAKTLVRQSLGSDADPELVREAVTLYRAIVRDLPSDGPSVRQLVASRCRHAVLATRYANEATKAGLATPTGIKLAEQARAHDLAAQRLAVTAFDIATREAASHAATSRVDPLAKWLAPKGSPE